MRSAVLALLAFAACGLVAAQTLDNSPQLLLTPQRLRRLKRDRERQTVRWVNFENRLQAVGDSSERGFELALYYAVTGNEKRGREAIDWALSHRCQQRQVALVLDWAATLISSEERLQLVHGGCPPRAASIAEAARDALFMGIAQNDLPDVSEDVKNRVLERLQSSDPHTDSELYASFEFLGTMKTILRIDLRKNAPQFFTEFPSELLVSLKPDQVEHPGWMRHIAALALVELDPNLESSQYLQGWAMEDSQMIREGPGVAYEFLWADPYLPGVGYQNLDPWIYDSAGRLFARVDWTPSACWIGISINGTQEANCSRTWKQTATVFGHMTLFPMTQSCLDVPHRKNNEVAIVWKLRPRQHVSYVEDKQRRLADADAAGMWRVPANIDGKVCAAP